MPSRWQLSAPESHVLQYRGSCYLTEPFKLAVKELVTRRVLRVQRIQPGGLSGGRPEYALVDGPLIASEVPPPLSSVLGVYRAHRKSLNVLEAESTVADHVTGVSVKQLRKAARQEFGKVEHYHVREVVPALVERGLLSASGSRGLKREPDWDWTPAGRQADSELGEWMALGRKSLASCAAKGDLLTAAAYVEGAGALLLLMPDLYPELQQLESRLQQSAVGHGAADGPDTRDGLHLDFGSAATDFGGAEGSGGVGDLGGLGDLGGFAGGGDGGGL